MKTKYVEQLEMIKEDLKKELDSVRIIDDERNYWFVRSYGGEIFEDFILNNHIGLGFNNVPQEYIIESGNPENTHAHEQLYDFIENNTEYYGASITKWKNQLIRFQHEMKLGDIVIVPNKDSGILSIGEITGNVKLFTNKSTFFFKDEPHEYPNRVREVKWLKHRPKHFFQGELRNLLSSHQAITKADKYADKIESGISSTFIRENQMRLVINVNQDEDINAFALKDFLDSLTYFYKEFCIELGIEENENLFIKIKLQSKGKTVLIGAVALAIIGVSCIMTLSKDASFKASVLGQSFEFNSGDGLLNTFSEFLDKDQDRKIKMMKFIQSQEQLEVQEPKKESDSLTKEQFISKDKLEKKANN